MGSSSRTHHYQQLVEGKETGYYVVRIDHVFVQSLKICGIKRAGIMAYAILNYFGPPPFNIAVPYTMLRVHVQDRKQLLLESKNQWKNNIIQLAKNNNAIVTPSEQRTTNQQCTMAVTVTDEIKLCLMMLMIQMMNYIIVIMKGLKQIRVMKMTTSTKMAV